MDAGPIIAQGAVPVLPCDDEDTLSARILAMEHRLFPLALRLVATGAARLEGGRVVYGATQRRPFSSSRQGVRSEAPTRARVKLRKTPRACLCAWPGATISSAETMTAVVRPFRVMVCGPEETAKSMT